MPTLPCAFAPPTCMTRTVVRSVFFSSSAYFLLMMTRSPVKRCGQWHCSQVSRAGRRSWTGEGIGVE